MGKLENMTLLQQREWFYTERDAVNPAKGIFFNLDEALNQGSDTNPIFLTQSYEDAFRILCAGGNAAAWPEDWDPQLFVDAMKEEPNTAAPVVIIVDTVKRNISPTGRETHTNEQDKARVIQAALREAGYMLATQEPQQAYGGYETATAAYDASPDALREAIAELKANTLNGLQEFRQKEFRKDSVSYHMQEFQELIQRNRVNKAIATGFTELDNILDGGLHPGLYIVGAISSLGKTTLVHQIADQIAAQGKKVLFFSLEMAMSEIMAKSISRITAQIELEKHGSFAYVLRELKANDRFVNVKSTRGILMGRTYSDEDAQRVADAMGKYWQLAENTMWITEGIGNVTVDTIREKVEKFTQAYKQSPVVIVDYLQIITPTDVRATDKQNTDRAVLELKRISRDYSTPVIAISSFNRENYTTSVNMAAFKESGAIEYSSDVLIALQYNGMDKIDENIRNVMDKAIAARKLREHCSDLADELEPQSIQVKILKNRNGRRSNCLLDFYPTFNLFTDSTTTDEWEPEESEE